jgi:hypothetical protein
MLRPAGAFNTFPPDAYTLMAQHELFDRVHAVARLRRLSLGTERAYSEGLAGGVGRSVQSVRL